MTQRPFGLSLSKSPTDRRSIAWLQAAPFALVFFLFLVLPLALVAAVSFWQATDYELIPAFTAQNYIDAFHGCASTQNFSVDR